MNNPELDKRIENILSWILQHKDLINQNDFVKITLNIKLSDVKGQIEMYPDSKV